MTFFLSERNELVYAEKMNGKINAFIYFELTWNEMHVHERLPKSVTQKLESEIKVLGLCPLN